ncbi:MAG: hypothetical protein KDE58_11920 [Caldilineaceae bacterium]|nr:hypothetical protein [Caldilineaceae bacterium]
MVDQTNVDAEQQLLALAERFAHWRTTKRHRGDPIPEALWAEVGSLSNRLPQRHICRVLRLSDRDVQKRLGPGGVATKPQPTSTQALTFIDMTEALSTHTPPSVGVTEVAVERPDGARFQLHYTGDIAQLAPLVQSFLTAR